MTIDPGTIPPHALRRVIETALEEDAPWGDVTSETLIPADATATATLAAREPGVLSGGTVFVAVMHAVDPSIRATLRSRRPTPPRRASPRSRAPARPARWSGRT